MAYQSSNSRSSTGVSDLGSRLRCDVLWGRFLFQPPELTNPNQGSNPMPFRTHEYAPVRVKKSSGVR